MAAARWKKTFPDSKSFFFLQDTVVALQALALYSEETAGNAIDLRVKLTSELDPDWKPPEIHITAENALLRREIDVSAVMHLSVLCTFVAQLPKLKQSSL